MQLAERHPIIDEVLEMWSSALGPQCGAYTGHVYRVYNYARRLYGSSDRDDDFAIASVFHDLGIWSDHTFDYLAPSAARAVDFLNERGHSAGARLIEEIILNHHCLTKVRSGSDPRLVEAFRLADQVDLSGGWLRYEIDPGFVREVKGLFPYSGFHGILLRTACAWLLRHPWRPLPMVRIGTARVTKATLKTLGS